MAAAQALMKLDPAWMQAFLPQRGLDAAVMVLAPLDAIPERDFVRHRRYRRVRLPRNVPQWSHSKRVSVFGSKILSSMVPKSP